MTPKNKELRDSLKQIETTITSALAHQPEDDAQCGQFLYDALVSVFNTADLAAHKYRGVTTYCRPLAAAPAASSTPDGAAPSAPVPSVPEIPSVPEVPVVPYNSAKLREEIGTLLTWAEHNLRLTPNLLKEGTRECCEFVVLCCKHALAEPTRNCDVYTPEVLLNEFLNEMPEEVKNGTTEHERKLIELTAKGVIDALFAPYNPEKKARR